MKLKLLIIILCFLSNISIAQKSNKNELGLILYSNEMPFVRNFHTYNTDIKHAFVNGIQYKRSITERYFLRASAQYIINLESYESNLLYGYQRNYVTNSKKSMIDTRIGIEKVFLKTKIKPFVLIDLIYSHFNSESKSIYYDYLTNNGISRNYRYSENFAGVNLGLGVKYYINEHLYTSAEASIGSVIQIYKGGNSDFETYQPRTMFTFGVRF
jgi:hypothetical protein